MTTAKVKAEEKKLSLLIENAVIRLSGNKENFKAMVPILQAIPTTFSEFKQTVDNFPGGTIFQDLKKEELALHIADYQALVAAINLLIPALDEITEF